MKNIKIISFAVIIIVNFIVTFHISLAKEREIGFEGLEKSDVVTVNKGEKKKLRVVDQNGKKISIKWKSSDSKIVKVSKKGWVTGIKSGKAKVIAASSKLKKKIKCWVYVGKKVRSIKLKKNKYSLEKGKKISLKPTVKPENAMYTKLKYSSSNENVASVSSKGVVKAKAKGFCEITVSSKDSSRKTVSCVVVVKPVAVKKVSFLNRETTINVSQSFTQKVSVSPKKADNKKITYVSSNQSVATVTQSGKVTGKGEGKATIIAMTNDGSSLFASYVVHVVDGQDNLKHCKNKLKLISVYGDNNAYHPSVQNFLKPWNGYRYWMAYTPFPNANDRMENPHIAVSNDMVNWTIPKGFANPLDPEEEFILSSKQYNSDAELVYRSDTDTLECYWRRVDKALTTNLIYRRTTKDGVHWTKAEVALKEKFADDGLMSPAIIYEDGKYKMWTIDYHNNFPVCYRESADGLDWSKPRTITIPYKNGNLKNWHLDVIHTAKGYEMLIVAFQGSREEMSLYYTNSKDNQNYSESIVVLEPSSNEKGWDNRGLYRSSFFVENGLYYVFYSGIGKNGDRGIGLSKGTAITELKGYDR